MNEHGLISVHSGDLETSLDLSSTTPAAVAVLNEITEFLLSYGSVNRGVGPKASRTTSRFKQSLLEIRRFVGARDSDVVLLASNTTLAINRLASAMRFGDDDIVLISEAEHSSNELPWRQHANVARFRASIDGAVDLEDLEAELRNLGGRVRLVAATGASNVTGRVTPIEDVARIVHKYDAELLIDAAQLVAHRRITMQGSSEDSAIDYLVFSGHKMYAPFGVGCLIGRPRVFERVPPLLPGGGTVSLLAEDDDATVWAPLPERLMPGSPNAVGVVAIAAAVKLIEYVTFGAILDHERRLLSHGREVLQRVDGLRLYGHEDSSGDQIPIFSFTLNGHQHHELAAELGKRRIAVRSGHLCQFEFSRRQLGITYRDHMAYVDLLKRDPRAAIYGMVRASCGMSSTTADIDTLADQLHEISREGARSVTCAQILPFPELS